MDNTLRPVPIIGRRLPDKGIALLRKLLADAEAGNLVSFGAIAETIEGNMIVAADAGTGDMKRLCCAADLLHDQVKDMVKGAGKTKLDTGG